ncbi:ribokinase [Acetatifactor muris]|uniref:ribokinase n=1 Tax=Acetatifactor muris TaxID=879566 RepID=UPI0023F42628|nr:ribokinase [Acetatifactor muris]
MKVLVFGSLNIDYVYTVSHFVRPGETIASDELQLFCGGKGLNQSIAFGKSGIDTWHAGAVGNNDSEMLTSYLQSIGVHTDLIQKKEAPSGHAIIQRTPEGENSIVLYGGANQMVTEEDVDFVLQHFTEGDFIILQNEINQIPYIMEKARKTGMIVVLNPSPMDGKIFEMSLEHVDFLILNELEGAALSKASSTNPDEILNRLMTCFPNAQIVLTLGKEGAVYGYKDRKYYQPIYPVKTVDTTAAGDTFTGFFMGSIISGKSVEESLKTAAMASAIAVSRNGAGPSIPTLEEIRQAFTHFC